MGTKTILTFSLDQKLEILKKDPQTWGRKLTAAIYTVLEECNLKKDPQTWGRKLAFNYFFITQ